MPPRVAITNLIVSTNFERNLFSERRRISRVAGAKCQSAAPILQPFVTPQRMEEACAQALAHNIYSYKYFSKLLGDKKKQEPIIHENLRGKDYYQGGGHV